MKKTVWTEKRLQRLFDRYNRRYWKARLPIYSCALNPEIAGGRCESRERKIYINEQRFRTDRAVRETLVHEMVHAAIKGGGHGKLWQKETRRLAKAGAPVAKTDLDPTRWVRPRHVLASFEDAALDGTWKQILLTYGWEYGLVDSHGKPTGRRAERFIAKAKKAFQRARREYLLSKKLQRLSFGFFRDYRAEHPSLQQAQGDQLYVTYTRWCQQHKERPLSQREFLRSCRRLVSWVAKKRLNQGEKAGFPRHSTKGVSEP